MLRRSKFCLDALCKSLFLPSSSLNASRMVHSQSEEVVHPEMISSNQTQNWVTNNISEMASDPTNRLFAVVYIHRKQFKVSQGDIIQLEQNICLDVGEKIKFSKVLFVGGENFSVIGRPLLNSKYVDVNATVIEKTTTSPSVKYNYVGNHPHDVQWWSKELTVLRINDVKLDKRIFD
uniref:Large ribosomal subunit protein bL21m n=1 Tax=Ditylenchus dipsaci TaxID=166011 RepID=A0A915CTC4_9BILA